MPHNHVPITYLRRNWSNCLDQVAAGTTLTITSRGKPIAVLLPISLYEEYRWLEEAKRTPAQKRRRK